MNDPAVISPAACARTFGAKTAADIVRDEDRRPVLRARLDALHVILYGVFDPAIPGNMHPPSDVW